jgi:hypothetical protein
VDDGESETNRRRESPEIVSARISGFRTIAVGGGDRNLCGGDEPLFKKISYDPVKDLAPISKAAQMHIVVVVRNGLPVKSIKEFVAHAKANPGKLLFGSGGVGTSTRHATELFKDIAKIDIRHVQRIFL